MADFAPGTQPMIELRDVGFAYPNSGPALESVNLSVAAGEFVFVVGPTGCGKSTLLKLIYLDERVSSGQLYVLGRELTNPSRKTVPHIRRNLGIVFQDFQLLERKTIAENVAFALRVTGVDQDEIDKRVPLALKMVGLEDKANSFPDELSGGEQQRTALARGIINNPPILLADEPTGNLDPDTSVGIVKLIKKINDRGMTVVIATHDEAIVDLVKQRVVYLDKGRVISDTRGGGYRDAVQHSSVLPE